MWIIIFQNSLLSRADSSKVIEHYPPITRLKVLILWSNEGLLFVFLDFPKIIQNLNPTLKMHFLN